MYSDPVNQEVCMQSEGATQHYKLTSTSCNCVLSSGSSIKNVGYCCPGAVDIPQRRQKWKHNFFVIKWMLKTMKLLTAFIVFASSSLWWTSWLLSFLFQLTLHYAQHWFGRHTDVYTSYTTSEFPESLSLFSQKACYGTLMWGDIYIY